MNPQADPDIQTPVKTQAATPVRAAAALAAAALAAALFIGMDATVKTLANRFDAGTVLWLKEAALFAKRLGEVAG